MAEPSMRFNHINLPARDPLGLARWYAENFDLRQEEYKARSDGMLLVFVAGETLTREHDFHIGFQVPSNDALSTWAKKFGTEVKPGAEFNTFRTHDPEGNCIEVYCRADS